MGMLVALRFFFAIGIFTCDSRAPLPRSKAKQSQANLLLGLASVAEHEKKQTWTIGKRK
jgi:hypothetical protein